jgi:hypothetical protein
VKLFYDSAMQKFILEFQFLLYGGKLSYFYYFLQRSEIGTVENFYNHHQVENEVKLCGMKSKCLCAAADVGLPYSIN